MKHILASLILVATSGAVHADGHLMSDRTVGCIGVSEVTPDMTPPDLMNGVYACAAADDPERGVRLFFTALARAVFDRERVADESAHGAVNALQGQARTTLSADEAGELMQAYSAARADLAAVCPPIVALGPPEHDPTWMIAHGDGSYDGDALRSDFDPVAGWDAGLTFLICPR